ncbi:MAG: ABC transporter ATP-binding protein, partial [Dehalococcoidia bacterium]
MIEKKNEEWAVEVGGLTKSFGRQLVLRGIDLRVKKGEFLTIFGPNAAGKTTLIKILATLSRPSSGEVRLAGLQLQDDATEIRRRVGVVTHQTLLYDDLTVRENLRFYGRMYDVANLEERIATVIRQVGLEARLHDRVRTLSHGMQKRASIARAVIH